ncbi:DUF5753 domain-containing protein [Nonomuraea sp. NEAU-A123]|uniref:DUF5753 domain-containing protein n=1 Tax=Nonomuraea sp. NEAU-A123 TaxID=2839649 RepID=UPI001BE4A060|nr:DUF5753 domain-containing protein [Nonomuraea sp. NEAU-A123]MBT2226650.1 XRE family transcriptional regulator [Nonomuraea sp. NEAU-A123]
MTYVPQRPSDSTPSLEFTEGVERFLGLKGELIRLWPLVTKTASPAWFREWPKIEGEACTLRTWQPLVIPGLLQTRGYARAVLQGQPGITEDQVNEALEARLARQVIFTRSAPPIYSAIIDEVVLSRPIGGPEVMKEQLEHLVKLLSHPCITLQVVPMAAVPTIGLLGGFVIASPLKGGDTIYLDSAADGEVTDREDKVRTVSVRYDAIRSWARPVNETEDAIREKMVTYERP